MNKRLSNVFSWITIMALMLMAVPVQRARADSTTQPLPFSQNWTDTGLITTNDDWSGVPGVVGYRGDGLTSATGIDPQTVVADGTGTPVDVNANLTSPNTFTTGGVSEFELADPVVALQGSGTARAPFLLFHLNTTGFSSITVVYNLRDVDGSADNAVQPVALQYRVGSSGNFTNIPAGFVTDATTGPSIATLVTPISVVLPVDANNQTLVQVRVITTDAVGSDEWVGVDDINVTGTPIIGDTAPSVSATTPADNATGVNVDANLDITFSEAVDTSGSWFSISCGSSGVHTATVSGGPTIFTLDPDTDFANDELCTVTVFAAQITDQDLEDPPDSMEVDYVFSFTTASASSPSVFFNEIHYDNTGTDTGEAIEIAGPTCTDLTGWSVVLYNGTGGAVYNTTVLSGPIPNSGGGFGVVVLNYPSNGIQNGPPDGMALVDDGNNVIQFLSYEGTFTAVGGPADGMVSVDIGVFENGSGAVGTSLRLTGSGSTYNNFTWASAATSSFGAFNQGQTFTGGGSTNPCGVGAANPDPVFAGDNTLLTVNVISGTNPPSTGLSVTADLSSIGGSASQAFFDDGTNGDLTAGDNTFSYFATVSASTPPGVLSMPATITDTEARNGSAFISLTVRPPLAAIHTIQGASHLSPLAAQLVSTQGIVTAVASNGFYMQDPNPDADPATSEGIFVFTSSSPVVNVGNAVLVTGTVAEFRPGGNATANLATTEISGPGRSVTVLSSGNLLPSPTVIGTGGRIPPDMTIEDDNSGDMETDDNVFDVSQDGIDYYESLEGMLVQVNNPVVVGPRNSFGEIFVLGDDGANGGARTARGGIIIQPNDFNPERIQLDDTLAATPFANVGDHFTGPAVGVLDYNFGNFEILITSPMTTVPSGLTREVTGDPTDPQLSVASFNVENLSPNDPQSKFDTLASLIVNNLKSPDVIGLEEIQDNSGATDDGVVDADVTLTTLIAAIQIAGGPEYEYRQINPVDKEDGGAPGGNIRVGFLFNPDRVSFVDRPGGTSTAAVGVVNGDNGPELTLSPGRIDPTNAAFFDSRKPLAGEFLFRGDKVFVVVNHFNSKSGDDPLFGRFQPPVLVSEVQRLQQAEVVHDFVADILDLDPAANVVVAGDLNDFQFSNPLNTLKAGILVDLVETLPLAEQYTYVFEGNSQVLDHILASNRLASVPFSYDVVHVNSEFADQASDHEPEVALMCVDRTAPGLMVTVSPSVLWPPNHKYVTVNATVSVTDDADPEPVLTLVSVTSNEPDDAPGKEDGNTTRDIVVVDNFTFKLRAERSDLGTGRVYTITYRATDACGNATLVSATVSVPYQLGD